MAVVEYYVRQHIISFTQVQWPANVTHVYCKNRQLINFIGLPDTVTYIDVFGNCISSFEGLPPSITMINISCNKITSLKDLLSLAPQINSILCGKNNITGFDDITHIAQHL